MTIVNFQESLPLSRHQREISKEQQNSQGSSRGSFRNRECLTRKNRSKLHQRQQNMSEEIALTYLECEHTSSHHIYKCCQNHAAQGKEIFMSRCPRDTGSVTPPLLCGVIRVCRWPSFAVKVVIRGLFGDTISQTHDTQMSTQPQTHLETNTCMWFLHTVHSQKYALVVLWVAY